MTMLAMASRARNAFDGDERRVLLEEAQDCSGRIWPAGTVYLPVSCSEEYETVVIHARNVKFPAWV